MARRRFQSRIVITLVIILTVSALLRHFQNDFSTYSPQILFLNERGQCEGNTNFAVSVNNPASKLFISPVKLGEIGVQLINGSEPGTVAVEVAGNRVEADLQPDEVEQFVLRPRTGFPYIKRSYRVKARSSAGKPCLVRILPGAKGYDSPFITLLAESFPPEGRGS